MSTEPKKGDHVTWNTSRGTTSGTVEKELTHDVEIKSRTIKASNDDPKLLVKSEKTGAEAAHKPDSLEKR